MTGIAITRHDEARMRQRGTREADLVLVLSYGTEIDRDRIMLKGRNVKKVIGDLKRKIDAPQKLKGKIFVISGGCLVTAYHAKNSSHRSRQEKREVARDRISACSAAAQ